MLWLLGTSSTSARWGTTSSSIQLAHDWLNDLLQRLLLLVGLILGGGRLVLLEPRQGLFDGGLGGRLVFGRQFVSDLLVVVQGVLHLVGVTLKTVDGLDSFADKLVLLSGGFGLLDESLTVLLGQTSLVVGDGDSLLLTVPLSSADT